METNELHRGRLIDHIQLVVRDLAASRDFYGAIFEVLGIPIGGETESYFWADELFISSVDSEAAVGKLTGRHHLAFQAADEATVRAFHEAGLAHGGQDNGAPGARPYIPAIMLPSCSIRTATISRRFSMVSRSAAPRR